MDKQDQRLAEWPSDPNNFYRELTSRNGHFIDAVTQARISELKILIAGCGSAGGACTLPLARLGVRHFRLADNGEYELTNLNRQHCLLDGIGMNKAEFHGRQILGLNPHSEVKVYRSGLTPSNVREMVQWSDLVFDAVDVTTPDGMRMKLALHECAALERKPVYMPLDMGFCQWGQTFDYRKGIKPLRGRVEKARAARHPLKALFEFCPISAIPSHTLPMVLEVMQGGTRPVSQLACSVDILSAAFAAMVIRFASSGEVVSGWNIDVQNLALTTRQRYHNWVAAPFRRLKLSQLMRNVA